VESELADQLGVSRQPVREALQRLQTEGWSTCGRLRVAFVHEPTDEEADQLLAVRCLLETDRPGWPRRPRRRIRSSSCGGC